MARRLRGGDNNFDVLRYYVLEIRYAVAIITQYGSTVYIGIAMVYNH